MASSMHSFVFIFPEWVGHISPSLPLARELIERGHDVHYVTFESMRRKVEGTGAVFHSAVDCQAELFNGRGSDFVSMVAGLADDLGDVAPTTVARLWQLRPAMIELQLPGLLRLLRQLAPRAIVFCPLSCPEAQVASRVLGVPAVALNTFAGPGGLEEAIRWCIQEEQIVYEEFDQRIRKWQPGIMAARRMLKDYGVWVDNGLPRVPGYVDALGYSAVTLSTTVDGLELAMSPEISQAYATDGCVFEYVGPLLDRVGTWRSHLSYTVPEAVRDVVSRMRKARQEGRPVVFASMGTVITGDMPYWGWEGRPVGEDGMPYGLTGSELCRAAWSGVFEAFGSANALIILALGSQPNALGTIQPPPGAICAPAFPQVDILSAGVDVFLTHGGQNSFMEAMSTATPVVVCPGFSDQIPNGRKAVELGVGLKVDRPIPAMHERAAAIAEYRGSVRKALLEVASESHFAAAAGRCAKMVRQAGGVARAADLVIKAALPPCAASFAGA